MRNLSLARVGCTDSMPEIPSVAGELQTLVSVYRTVPGSWLNFSSARSVKQCRVEVSFFMIYFVLKCHKSNKYKQQFISSS